MNGLKTKANPSPEVSSKEVEYVPPSEEQIEKYATGVCKKFDEQLKADNPDRETRQGFVDFMKLAVKIEAKHRNPGGHHDK